MCFSGLFHKAIIQSGSALNPGNYLDPTVSVERAFKLGNLLCCPAEDSDKLLKCLQKVSAYKIIEAQSKVVSNSVSCIINMFVGKRVKKCISFI